MKNIDNAPVAVYFDNLVVIKGKNQQKAYVLRYEPTESWHKGPRNFAKYSGGIIFYNIDGHKLGKIEMDKGVMLKSRTSNNTFKSGCNFDFELVEEATVCTDGGSIDGEGSSVDWSCSTSYTFEVTYNCSGGGTGTGTDSPSDPSGGGDDSDGGSGTDTPEELTFAPNHPEPEYIKIENEIDDPCASLIFNQLHLASLYSGLPRSVSIRDNLDEDISFVDPILNMFNSSDEFDYIVEDDNDFSNPETSASTDARPFVICKPGDVKLLQGSIPIISGMPPI